MKRRKERVHIGNWTAELLLDDGLRVRLRVRPILEGG
jgi:hypothetical protein